MLWYSILQGVKYSVMDPFLTAKQTYFIPRQLLKLTFSNHYKGLSQKGFIWPVMP